jgi:molybdopterin synthase sulfur carrier subunit
VAQVTVRYWAAAKEAAGIAEETVTADTLAGALEAVTAARRSDARFSAVLARSSFLVDEHPAGLRAHDSIMLADGAVVEVLPASAGG